MSSSKASTPKRRQPNKALVSFCRKLPHTTEDIKWEHHLCFSIGGKMFACFPMEGTTEVSFRVTPDEFSRLTQLDGVIPAPYAARFYWIAITRRGALPSDMLRELLRGSYQIVADRLPLKTRRALGMVVEASRKGAKSPRK
jgi:predicted DNA-binding protein (MmcQ/YjbR family)